MSFVTLWKQTSTGHCADITARYELPPKKALIAAYMQLKGNYNTWEYPKDIDGIVKSTSRIEKYEIELDNGDILMSVIA